MITTVWNTPKNDFTEHDHKIANVIEYVVDSEDYKTHTKTIFRNGQEISKHTSPNLPPAPGNTCTYFIH